MQQLEKLQQQQQRYVTPYSIALIYAGLDEKDQAFKWLEEAFKDRSIPMLYLKAEPMLDSLRSDPRMSHLIQRMGLDK